jgi:hypothetical protein
LRDFEDLDWLIFQKHISRTRPIVGAGCGDADRVPQHADELLLATVRLITDYRVERVFLAAVKELVK